MFDRLDIFQLSGGMARHASIRQNVIARNIANADTPGYKTRDVAPFATTITNPLLTGSFAQRGSRVGHFRDAGQASNPQSAVAIGKGSASPNGNSVSLETEMVKSAQVRNDHQMAISVYKSTMQILRTSLGRR
jgi:flagellar basal-body rod protein FlgB